MRNRGLTLLIPMLVAVGFLVSATNAFAEDSNSKYWDFAQVRAQSVESRWDQKRGAFLPFRGALDTRMNANMLNLYALAAKAGMSGAVRNDERARSIVDLLTRAPAYVTSASSTSGNNPGSGVAHYPGWTGNASGNNRGEMHMSIDPKVADALAAAWDARDALGLSPTQVTTIVSEITAVANGPFFRYPSRMLNQFNWAAEMWRHAADVSESWTAPTTQYRQFLSRFTAGITKAQPDLRQTNLNSGLGFSYCPECKSKTQLPNLTSSTEYGNIVFGGLKFYDEMVSHGMERLSPEDEDMLKAWSLRIMAGEWTHSGYTNWDTGLGLLRWHLGRYWAWSLEGLLSLGSQTSLAADPNQVPYAAWLLDRALGLYATWNPSGGYLFGIPGTFASAPDDDTLLNASRFAVMAAKAATAGWGAITPASPPAMYAHDPDVRRVAVTTPSYSTALLPSQYETKYGGAELVRLFDSSARPLSGVGGSQTHAFGIIIKRGALTALRSQPGSLLGHTQSQFTAKVGESTALRGFFGQPDPLTVTGTLSSPKFTDKAVVTHTFTNETITTSRALTTRGGSIYIYFPIKGDHPTVTVGGEPLTETPTKMDGRTLQLTTDDGGSYTAAMFGLPPSATVSLIASKAQATNPGSIYSAVVKFVLSRPKTMTFGEVITPAPAS